MNGIIISDDANKCSMAMYDKTMEHSKCSINLGNNKYPSIVEKERIHASSRSIDERADEVAACSNKYHHPQWRSFELRRASRHYVLPRFTHFLRM